MFTSSAEIEFAALSASNNAGKHAKTRHSGLSGSADELRSPAGFLRQEAAAVRYRRLSTLSRYVIDSG